VLSERLPCLLEWPPNLERAVSALAEDWLLESSVQVYEPPAGRHQLADSPPRVLLLGLLDQHASSLCVDAIYEDVLARVRLPPA
jgi:hypothetical protein